MRILNGLLITAACFIFLTAILGASWIGMLLSFGAISLFLPFVTSRISLLQLNSTTRFFSGTVLALGALGVTMATVNSSPEGRAIAAEQEGLGRHCLSYDGSPEKVVTMLKSQMGNPDSFEHTGTTIEPADASGQHLFSMRYRAENKFGGMSVETVEGTIDNGDCRPTSFN